MLNIDFVIGTSPRIENHIIQGIELEDFNGRNFKVDGCKEIIEKYGFAKEDIIAIGDSPSDKGVFELAHQNTEFSGRKVGISKFDISTVVQGKMFFYRPTKNLK